MELRSYRSEPLSGRTFLPQTRADLRLPKSILGAGSADQPPRYHLIFKDEPASRQRAIWIAPISKGSIALAEAVHHCPPQRRDRRGHLLTDHRWAIRESRNAELAPEQFLDQLAVDRIRHCRRPQLPCGAERDEAVDAELEERASAGSDFGDGLRFPASEQRDLSGRAVVAPTDGAMHGLDARRNAILSQHTELLKQFGLSTDVQQAWPTPSNSAKAHSANCKQPQQRRLSQCRKT